MHYKLQRPITTIDKLKSNIPAGESLPLWCDDEWILFYINIWKNVYRLSPGGSGEFFRRKFFLYQVKPIPEFVIERREYDANNIWGEKISTHFLCPNCDEDLIPYDYDFERQLIGHTARVKYCPACGYPILWY